MANPTQFGARTRQSRPLRRAVYCASFVIVLACSVDERDYSAFDGDAGSAGKGGSAGTSQGGKAGAGKGGSAGGGKGGNGGSSTRAGEGGEPSGSSGAAGSDDGGAAGAGASSGEDGGGTSGAGGENGGAGGESASGGTSNMSGSGGTAPCVTSDPDCECVNGVVVARDRDEDNAGATACEEAPGTDCDDLDQGFIRNACGGCVEDLGGTLNAACNGCGTLRCSGTDLLVCTTPNPAPRRCLNATTPQLCVSTNWATQAACSGTTPRCFEGGCVECTPGTFKCEVYPASDDQIIYRCDPTGFWESSWFASCYGSSSEVCSASTGSCVLGMLHPRDANFEVIPVLGMDPEEYRHGVPTGDVLDRITGLRFG